MVYVWSLFIRCLKLCEADNDLPAGHQHYQNEETCLRHVYKIMKYRLMHENIRGCSCSCTCIGHGLEGWGTILDEHHMISHPMPSLSPQNYRHDISIYPFIQL